MCTTNPQILIVICCTHLHIHHMLRIPFHILSFLDFVVISSTNVAILLLLFKRAIVMVSLWHCQICKLHACVYMRAHICIKRASSGPPCCFGVARLVLSIHDSHHRIQLTDSQHYKRHRSKIMIEFHSRSHFTLKTT